MATVREEWHVTYDNLESSTQFRWSREENDSRDEDYQTSSSDGGNYSISSSHNTSDSYTDESADENPQIGFYHVSEQGTGLASRSDEDAIYRWPTKAPTSNDGEDNQDWGDQPLEEDPATLSSPARGSHGNLARAPTFHTPPHLQSTPTPGTLYSQTASMSSRSFDTDSSSTSTECVYAMLTTKEESGTYHFEERYSEPLYTGEIITMLKNATNVPFRWTVEDGARSQLYFSGHTKISGEWAVDLSGHINAARAKFRWTRQNGDIYSPETVTWNETFWPQILNSSISNLTGFEQSIPICRVFSYTFPSGQSISPYFTQDPWNSYFSKGPSMLVQASHGTPSGYGKLGDPIEIEEVISDQIAGNETNKLPTPFYRDASNPMLMATRSGADARLSIKINVPAANAASIRVGVRQSAVSAGVPDSSVNTILASVPAVAPPGKTMLSFTALAGSKNYEVVAGYDANTNGILDKSEAIFRFQKTPKTNRDGRAYSPRPGTTGDPTFALLDRFIVVTEADFTAARAAVDGYGGLPFSLTHAPAAALIQAFARGSNTVPGASPTEFGVLLDASVIPSADGLSHPVGGKWNAAKQTNTHRLVLPDGSALSDKVEDSDGIKTMWGRIL